MEKKTVLKITHILEEKILRNSYYLQDLQKLKKLLNKHNPEFASLEDKYKNMLLKLINNIEYNFAPFIKLQNRQKVSSEKLLEAHIVTAERVTQRSNSLTSEEHMLYKSNEGKKLYKQLQLIKKSIRYIGKIKPEDWIDINQNLFQDVIIYPEVDSFKHNIEILGILEARLGSSDLTIIGGLTEGVFPRNINTTNAWLNSTEIIDLKLPSPDRIIGLAAHDFYMLSSNPMVVFTYANYSESELTQRNRWIDRIVALSKTLNISFGQKHLITREWMLQDRKTSPARTNFNGFSPPKNARIRKISISDLHRLEKEPYAIYAKNILNLKPLNPIIQKPNSRIFGIILHQILENYFKSNIYSPNYQKNLKNLLSIAHKQIKPFDSFPETYAFWIKKLELITNWVIKNDIKRRKIADKIYIEVPGKLVINTHLGQFTLTGRADRIEITNNEIIIIDYKSGILPKSNSADTLSSPQLPIEILIAQNKGFSQIQIAKVKEAIYWHLDGLNDGGKELNALKVNTSVEEISQIANRWAKNLLIKYANPKTPFLPQRAIYEDYKNIQRTITLEINNNFKKDKVGK